MREDTGFADVDASGRSEELVNYLELVARHVGAFRREGYELMRLKPGHAVLDVGCGKGEVCAELAVRVGPRGRVAGVDLSEAMIAAAWKATLASGPRGAGAAAPRGSAAGVGRDGARHAFRRTSPRDRSRP
jgi:SAM-dependent methyltransferase